MTDQYGNLGNSPGTKRSLRRKPPPSFEFTDEENRSALVLPNSQYLFSYVEPFAGDNVLPLPREDAGDANLFKLTINTGNSEYTNEHTRADRRSIVVEEGEDTVYDDEFNEESLNSYDSPRPMGPKSLPLPDFEESSTPTRPHFRPQNLRKMHQAAPYPTIEIQMEIELLNRRNSIDDESSYNFYSPELTPSRLRRGRNSDHYESSPTNSRTSEIITQSMGTPSKIPSLNETGTLGIPRLPLKGLVSMLRRHDRDVNLSDNSGRSSSSSPSSRNSKLINTLGGISESPPRQSSPTRSHTMMIPERNSPTGGNYMERVHSERQHRGSRSPSPKKFNERSSSLIYGQNSVFMSDHYSDASNINDYELEDRSDDNSYRQRKWNSVDTRESKSDISDYQYYDDEDPYSDIPESSTTNYFDYSNLPELPSANTSADGQPSSPSKRMTLSSTISFLKRESQPNLPSPTVSISTRRRKDDDLPPVPLDLPQLPFSSSSLASQHFNACKNVWSLSGIFDWCLKLKTWLHDMFIPKREFKKSLIKLLIFYKRDVMLDIIGQNVDQIIDSFLKAKAITYEFENNTNEYEGADQKNKKENKRELGVLINNSVYISGVLPDLLTCYCHDKDHTPETGDTAIKLKCYSTGCNMNKAIDHEIRLRNTNINEIVVGDDWASHWKLTADDLRKFNKTISKRQSLIFDLLKYEQTFIQRAKCFVEIVGPEFIKAAHILVGSHEIVLINKFEDDVLNPGQELIQIHEKSLFEPLLRILISDGKFIKGLVDIANIYSNWSKVVKTSLLKYISTVPMIEDLLRNENMKRWADIEVRNIERVKELKVNGSLLFLSTFNSRYQQLPLQLADIRNLFDAQDQEYTSLTNAIDNIRRLGSKVNEMKVHADNIHALKKIHKHLVWKNNVNHVNVNLGSANRKFFHRGDLTRKGDLKINTYANHVILLDNFLFITEKVKNPKMSLHSYKVVENPIPIESLLFEIKEKETGSSALELKPLTKSLSTSPVSPVGNSIENQHDEIEPSSFPFKIRYAGRGKHNAFTFTTKSEKERKDWINCFTIAKTNLCRRLRRTEPYGVEIVSNTNFAYDFGSRITKLQFCAPYEPVEEVSTDSLNRLNELGYKGDIYNFYSHHLNIIFSKAQSIASFEYGNTAFYLVGLASGIYCCDMKNGWKRIAAGTDISKIKVITSINLVIVLSSKHLACYSLDLVVGVYYGEREHMSSISLSHDQVSFFVVGKHREIDMLFYAKKKGNSSGATNFKVLIPETDNDGVFNTFKVIKKFYVQAECYGISIFNTSFAVHTNKGFEILELDKLLPRSVPEFPHGESSSKKIDGFSRRSITNGTYNPGIELVRRSVNSTNIKPMGMFKLNNNTEFLLIYHDFAIFTNKHGKLSRYSLLNFDFKAKSIAFANNHLFLVTDEVIEVWSISDFVHGSNRLIQIIVGKDISMLSSEEKICFSMANPKVPGLQLLFSLQPKQVAL